jgi:hypothetical protein
MKLQNNVTSWDYGCAMLADSIGELSKIPHVEWRHLTDPSKIAPNGAALKDNQLRRKFTKHQFKLSIKEREIIFLHIFLYIILTQEYLCNFLFSFFLWKNIKYI